MRPETPVVASTARDRARDDPESMRAIADRMFARTAGAPLIEGNAVRLLEDARENYLAWHAAIGAARHHIYLEIYILHDDEVGESFANALVARAREGVSVRVVYDWLGGRKTSRSFWKRLRAAGVEVRCFNPPRLDSPLGWLSRDHRKLLAVDGDVGFVTGLCIGRMWVGQPERGIEPWRDTGVEIRGPAVAQIERAFAEVWAGLGPPIAPEPLAHADAPAPIGDVGLRIVATVPATASLFRLDQLVVALARRSVWITDAYFAGTTSYVRGLIAAAHDGVDVRLLVPNATDIPVVKLLSRAGYGPMLAGGVRIFEWKGSMLHAKTAVTDGRWARVGSTNLNVASWLGNYELDAVIEDERFADQMEAMYLRDLENATEIVLDARQRVRASGDRGAPERRRHRGGGSATRAVAGAARLGNTVGAAFTDRRVLEPVESRLATAAGAVLSALALVFAFYPRLLAVPVAALLGWLGVALLLRGWALRRSQRKKTRARS